MYEYADADYVVILNKGQIAAEGTPLQLKNAYTGDFVTIYGVEEQDIKWLERSYEKLRDAYRIAVGNTEEVTKMILEFPDIFKDYEITKGKMDDVFLKVTGISLTEGGGVQ